MARITSKMHKSGTCPRSCHATSVTSDFLQRWNFCTAHIIASHKEAYDKWATTKQSLARLVTMFGGRPHTFRGVPKRGYGNAMPWLTAILFAISMKRDDGLCKKALSRGRYQESRLGVSNLRIIPLGAWRYARIRVLRYGYHQQHGDQKHLGVCYEGR